MRPVSSVCAAFVLCLVMASDGMSSEPESLFPRLAGWRVTQDDAVYDANNLWDIIDGAADLYLEYGFVDLHTARYEAPDGTGIRVEIYRQSSPENAFGIYSQERDTAYNFIPIGVQGYLQRGVLNFLSGVYYVKLSTHQTGRKVQDALVKIGRCVEEHLKQSNAWPEVLRAFPERLKVPNAEQFVARNFLGHSFLASAYVATYGGAAPFRMFVIDAKTPDAAKAMVQSYLKAVPADSIKMVSEEEYEIRDPHNGGVAVVRRNHFLCGITARNDERTSERYLRELLTTLSP